MLNPFLMNLGLQQIFDPFPRDDSARFVPLVKREGVHVWRGDKMLQKVLEYVKKHPGVSTTQITKYLRVDQSHTNRIAKRLADAGHLRYEHTGDQKTPRTWYAI